MKKTKKQEKEKEKNIRVWYLHQENKQIPWQQKLKGKDHQKLRPCSVLMFFFLISIIWKRGDYEEKCKKPGTE